MERRRGSCLNERKELHDIIEGLDDMLAVLVRIGSDYPAQYDVSDDGLVLFANLPSQVGRVGLVAQQGRVTLEADPEALESSSIASAQAPHLTELSFKTYQEGVGEIIELLDSKQWSVETLDDIAAILRDAGN